MSILRDISRAKTLLKAVGNITQRIVPSGTAVVKQGEIGDSMYTVVTVRSAVADGIAAVFRSRFSWQLAKYPESLAIFGHLPTCHTDSQFGSILIHTSFTSLCRIKRDPRTKSVTCVMGGKPRDLLGCYDFPCSIIPHHRRTAVHKMLLGLTSTVFQEQLV